MKFRHIFIALIVIAFISGGCKKHFISDPEYRRQVKEMFVQQKKLAGNRENALFSVFKQSLSLKEKEALEFLYAFMPLSDLADYDGEYFLSQVKWSFLAKENFSWGKKIPEDIFRHFVLPIRVNNENLDTSRGYFYRQLKPCIEHLGMKDAALEVNHWCHEKVSYKASDGRTRSPLATLKNAQGRCGEESTFAVAAFRSVGIPARQVYVPRWSHCDDNHAWVEVWVDGQWYYLGACEPEPELNMGWFSGPASRAMQVNTNVYGIWKGTQEVLLQSPRHTRINVLETYAPVKKLVVKVINEKEEPVSDARTEFQVYNYAEFYPIASKQTDEKGYCTLITGNGDLLVWAAKNNRFGFTKADTRNSDTVEIQLSLNQNFTGEIMYDFVPPNEKKDKKTISEVSKTIHQNKLKKEDSLRKVYEITFPDSSNIVQKLNKIQVSDNELVKSILKSRGNYQILFDFLFQTQPKERAKAISLINSLIEKDLQDISLDVLKEMLQTSENVLKYPDSFFTSWVLNPRCHLERLKPHRKELQVAFDENFKKTARQNPLYLLEWIEKNIKTETEANWSRCPLTPVGSFQLKVADPISKHILFVALCRSFGIAARINQATGKPEFAGNNLQWIEARISKNEVSSSKTKLTIISTSKEFVPKYSTHFTIGQFQDGFYRTLDYEDAPCFLKFPAQIEVYNGSNLLVTGIRLQNGTVLARLQFFNVSPKQNQNIELVFRNKEEQLLNTKQFNTNIPLLSEDRKNTISTKNLLNNSAVAFIWIEPGKEPTRHLLAELAAQKKEFNCLNVFFACIVSKGGAWGSKESWISSLPDNRKLFYDEYQLEKEIIQGNKSSQASEKPLVVLVNYSGAIVYYSTGYKIGLAAELLHAVKNRCKNHCRL